MLTAPKSQLMEIDNNLSVQQLDFVEFFDFIQ